MTTPRTQQHGVPVFPPGRYGRRREPRRVSRWVPALLLVGVLVAGLGIAVRLNQLYGTPEYRGVVRSYSNVTDSEITVTFDVYKPPGEPAVCTVRARAVDGAEVGRAEVRVPAGDADTDHVRVTYTLQTERRPVTGEVPGCGPARS